MPLVTVTLQQSRTAVFKASVLDAVHRSLVAAGVPETDRFQRVLELDADHFRFDATYPDAATPRDAGFVLIEILWSIGRSVRIKRKLVSDITRELAQSPGLNPEHVMIVFTETAWEN